MRELDGAVDRRVDYVCAIAYVDGAGDELVFEARCEGELARERSGTGGFGYDPAFVPRETGPGDARTMAELSPERKHALSHRGRAARLLASHLGLPARPPDPGDAVIRTKTGAATLSVVSNSVLIALKLAAGAITGSIAIITEALHSAIDLMASVIALVSVRKADEPADAEHPYGHEKVENLAAAIEGMLILVGAGVIIYEATRRLAIGSEIQDLGVGIAVIAFSALANFCVAPFLRKRSRELHSPALEGDAAHLATDALTSVGVLVGLFLVEIDRGSGLRLDRGPLRRGGDRRLGHPDPHPLRPGARRRGSPRRRARPDRGVIAAQRADARDRRLPQAPRATGGRPDLRRHASAVPRGNHARARPRARPPPPRRDRGRDSTAPRC